MAKDKVLMGPERRSMIISENEKRVTAYHEAGHALVGKMMKGSDPVHKVTIIPRGRALGVTQQLPMEDRLNLSKDGADDQIAVAMGGRVAEELIFGQITTGASNDIQVGDRPGPQDGLRLGHVRQARAAALRQGRGEVFLGRDFAEHKDYSEQTAIEIDAEVRRHRHRELRAGQEGRPGEPREAEELAEALLEYETLEGGEIDLLFAGKPLDRPPPARPPAAAPRPPRPPPRRRRSDPGIFPGRCRIPRRRSATPILVGAAGRALPGPSLRTQRVPRAWLRAADGAAPPDPRSIQMALRVRAACLPSPAGGGRG